MVINKKNIRRILSLKIFFNFPKRCKYVHFGKNFDEKLISSYFFHNKIEVLPIISESLNLLILLKSLFNFSKENLVQKYYECYVKAFNPKILFSINDNYIHFYSLSKKLKNIKTILIQNGRRAENLDIFSDIKPNKSYFVDYMFVFGKSIGDKYSKYIKGSKIYIGSFTNNHFFTGYKSYDHKSENVFFISSWRANLDGLIDKNNNLVDYNSYFSAYRLVINFLSKWCIENNKKLNICLSSFEESQENNLEISFFNKNSNYIINNFIPRKNRYSSYEILNNNGVFVYLDTTLGLEALARGKRTAAISILGYLLNWNDWKFGWPMDLNDYGPFWCNKVDTLYYEKMLKFLFEVDEDKWLDICREYIYPIIKADCQNKKFKEIIRINS